MTTPVYHVLSSVQNTSTQSPFAGACAAAATVAAAAVGGVAATAAAAAGAAAAPLRRDPSSDPVPDLTGKSGRGRATGEGRVGASGARLETDSSHDSSHCSGLQSRSAMREHHASRISRNARVPRSASRPALLLV